MIHHIYANTSNVGDWLSAQGIRSLLPGVPVTESLCDEPQMPRTAQALEELPDGALVIVGGGGLLMDYFTPLWQELDRHAARLRVVLWGIGVVDLKREASLPPRQVVRRVADRAVMRVVRDARSAELIGAEAEVVPCPSLVRLHETPAGGRGACHAANFTTVGPEIYEIMVEQIREFCRETDRTYRETNNRIEPGDVREMAAVLLRYSSSDLVVSSRLHGCIIGLALGRPVVAVSGDHKIDEFMAQAGLSDWVLAQDEVSALPARLGDLGSQTPPREFLDRARAANADVGHRVAAMTR